MEKEKIDEIKEKIGQLWSIYINKKDVILKFQYDVLLKLCETFIKKEIYFSIVNQDSYKNSYKKDYIFEWWDLKSIDKGFLHIILWDFSDYKKWKYIWFWSSKTGLNYSITIDSYEENPEITEDEIHILKKIKEIIPLKYHKPEKDRFWKRTKKGFYNNETIKFDEIEGYFEKIDKIITEYNIWKRIWKFTFIKELNERLDYIIQDNNIDLNKII